MPSRRAVIVSSCEPCASARSKSRPFAQRRSARSRDAHLPRLAERASGRRDGRSPSPSMPVQLDQLQRLRVVARRDLHLVALLLAAARSSGRKTSRCALAVMSTQTLTRRRARASAPRGGCRSTCRSYQSVNASRPQSWREQSSRPATCSSSSARRRPRAEEALAAERRGRERLAGERLELAAQPGRGRDREAALAPCTTSCGSSGSTALRSSRFFAGRAPCAAPAARTRSSSRPVSMNGTRASSDWAIDARSVFTSRSSTR